MIYKFIIIKKKSIFTIRIFSGFMSLCTTPREWAYLMAPIKDLIILQAWNSLNLVPLLMI